MFPWKKRDEGFEWRDYVRTTVLARRAERRQKIEEAKHAAVESARDAGRKGAEAGRRYAARAGDQAKEAGRWGVQAGAAALAAGARAMSAGGRALAAGGRRFGASGGRAFAWSGQALGAAGRNAGSVAASWMGATGRAMAPATRASAARLASWWELIRDPHISGWLTVASAGLALACAARILTAGVDLAAILSGAGSALLFLASAGPDLARRLNLRMPAASLSFDSPVLRAATRYGGLAALTAAVIGAGYWAYSSWPQTKTTAARPSAPAASANAVRGRAVALSGDLLRVGGRTVRISGVEAPERDQDCRQPSGEEWNCGRAATQALTRLVSGRVVTCELSGSDDAGNPRGVCQARDRDLGGALVEKGHVFATRGFLSSYASLEDKAKAARVGLWRGGAERPAQYREKLWAEAKRKAPDGCPIKGRTSGDERIYVLPWHSGYDRIKLRPAKGERWFCSESEAQAAGWKARG